MDKNAFNNALLQNILHNIDIGIHVIDENRKTIVYNDAMGRIEGLDPTQVLNRDLLEVFPSLDENSSTLINALTEKNLFSTKLKYILTQKGKRYLLLIQLCQYL